MLKREEVFGLVWFGSVVFGRTLREGERWRGVRQRDLSVDREVVSRLPCLESVHKHPMS